jgi:hypothetical protein
LWKSEDYGDTWRQVFDITQFPGADFPTALELHPRSDSTIYCTVTEHQGPTGLLHFGKTYDDGETWTFYQEGLPQAGGSDILLDGVPPTRVRSDPWGH